ALALTAAVVVADVTLAGPVALEGREKFHVVAVSGESVERKQRHPDREQSTQFHLRSFLVSLLAAHSTVQAQEVQADLARMRQISPKLAVRDAQGSVRQFGKVVFCTTKPASPSFLTYLGYHWRTSEFL